MINTLLGGASIAGLGGGSPLAGLGDSASREKSAAMAQDLVTKDIERWKADMADQESKTEAICDLYMAARRVALTVNCPQYLIDATTDFEKAHKLFEHKDK
jgi:hypothetical protein